MNPNWQRRLVDLTALLAGVLLVSPGGESAAAGPEPRPVRRVIHAEVVALDQPYFYNRLGANAPDGMIYALKRDVVPTDGSTTDLQAGKVRLARTPAARALFEHLGRAGIWVRAFADDPSALRFGLPGDAKAWRRVQDALSAFAGVARA